MFRNDLIELIQYAPTTPRVWKRPQINKFYSMDLSPDKSIVRFLLESGVQTLCLSWRNPTVENRDWGLDTYVAALDEAVDAVRDISGSDDVSMMGTCSGGITSAAYLATLGAAKIKNLVLCVCLLDTATASDSAFGSLVTPETMMAAKEASRLRGVLDGHDLARMFAWMRPNDLIWNYWVNNYLLGNAPPAFDILCWNADTTRLPARLHGDYIDLYFTNPFVNAGNRQWVIPPEANAGFVAAMEDVLETYQRPRDPDRPLVCLPKAVAEGQPLQGCLRGHTRPVEGHLARAFTKLSTLL